MKMRKWKKNKGFTLVELIVAVAILAVIVTPLLGNFVQSAKINQKARQNLNGMNMAQDIMEGMSSFTGDEIINMFESGATLQGTVLPATTTYASHGDIDAAGAVSFESAVGGTPTGTPIYSQARTYDSTNFVSRTPIAADDYHFFVDGVEMAGHTYNYDITLKSIIKNKKAQAATIDKTYDAVYSAPDVYSASISDPVKGFGRFGVTAAELMGHIHRSISLSVVVDTKGDSDPDNDEYPVRVTDMFEIDSGYFTSQIHGADRSYMITSSTNIFTNSAAKKPENIYIYYPASLESATSVAREEFQIQNMTNNDVNVFLIRQKSVVSGVPNSAGSAAVKISDEGDDGNQHTFLITNARFNLDFPFSDNLRNLKENGQPNDDEYLADMYDVPWDAANSKYLWPTTYYDKNRCSFTYRQGSMASYQPIQDAATSSTPAYNDIISDGIMKRNSAAAYDVEIVVNEVMKSGTLKKVAAYEGALAN